MKLKYQIAVTAMGILLVVVPYLFWRRAPQFVRTFFTSVTSPLNLAIFRVVFFLLLLFSFSVDNVVWFGSLPADLQFAPTGLQWALAVIPINESFAQAASMALVVACLACILGLFSRTSIIICLVLSLYVLGLPQFFGKINHYHHLIWFMAILAVSPCSDVLSIDAVRKALKRADRGITEPPGPSQAYALPLRFVWLLMGVIYFTAGFWKLWTAGYQWAWSDNPRNIMYNKWMELSGWLPAFRIDQYPLLYKLSGMATLVFELSFIFLIFFPAVRFLAPLGALAFHNMTNIFMKISFWNLQGCYVAFVDWAALFKSVGHRLFPREMYVIYDGNCKLCRRTIASFRVFDLCDRVTYFSALDTEALSTHGLSGLDSEALRHMHVVVGGNKSTGFAAYREWMKRLPLFWPVLPLLYVPLVSSAGRKFYEHVAGSRACGLVSETAASEIRLRRPNRAIVAVGSFLLYATILSAVVKLQSWPLALYPSFEDPDKPEVSILTMAAQNGEGVISEIRPISSQSRSQLPPERLMGLQNRLLNVGDYNERRQRLRAFWQRWVEENPSLGKVTSVKFYRDTVSSIPEDQNNLLQRELIYELRVESLLTGRNDYVGMQQ